MRVNSFRTTAACTLLLAACFGNAPETPSMISMAARNGAAWSYQLLTKGTVTPLPPLRPSAMLGPYVAAFLSAPFFQNSHASVSGVLSGMAILYEDDDGIRDESYALLEELGLALQVELNDYLNRSLDRQMALDTYREGLIDVATRAQEHLAVLEQRQDDIDEQVREIRRMSSEIQRSLNEALRAKDYASAGSHQSDLSEVQGELAVASSTQKEIRNITRLFETSLKTAAERLEAIDANREALIAGVSVTDIPGSEDIGVLEDAPRGRRTADPEDVFGPTQPTE